MPTARFKLIKPFLLFVSKKIYLPAYAKDQLETSDDSSIWAKPIPYKEKPMPGFNYETRLSDDTLELGEENILRGGYYYPDMDQDLEATIECFTEVKVPKQKVKKERTRTIKKAAVETPLGVKIDEVLSNYKKKPGKDYEESEEPEEKDEPKQNIIPRKDLEALLDKVKPRIEVKGPTLIYTEIRNYQVFFDEKGEYINAMHENDGQFNSDYQESHFTHFGIAVKYFSLPEKLSKMEESISDDESALEGAKGDDPAEYIVIDNILLPFLKKAIKKVK
jgi:hypothetical protein